MYYNNFIVGNNFEMSEALDRMATQEAGRMKCVFNLFKEYTQ